MKKVSVPGVRFIKQTKGVSEYTLLSNGLQVLIKEDHFAPVATFMVAYRVGSRHEATGNTGATHLLEHLMFKGSKKYNKKRILSKYFDAIGAEVNAFTWPDGTSYFETLSPEHIEDSFKYEADRMRNATFSLKDKEMEMPVVRNEFERGENNPSYVVHRELWATAYHAHPYHHQTIGWKSDIEKVSIEKLREFYDMYYHPNNATLIVTGAIDTKEMLLLAKKYFGNIPASKKPVPVPYTEEPEQEGRRTVEIKRKGETEVFTIAWKIPPALHKDTDALYVLRYILSGRKSSLLQDKLVSSGLAASVDVYVSSRHDNGLFIIQVYPNKNVSLEKIEKELKKNLNLFGKKGPTKKEMDISLREIRYAKIWENESPFKHADTLSEGISVGHWEYYLHFLDRLEKVSQNDVSRVFRDYIKDTDETAVYYRALEREKAKKTKK